MIGPSENLLGDVIHHGEVERAFSRRSNVGRTSIPLPSAAEARRASAAAAAARSGRRSTKRSSKAVSVRISTARTGSSPPAAAACLSRRHACSRCSPRPPAGITDRIARQASGMQPIPPPVPLSAGTARTTLSAASLLPRSRASEARAPPRADQSRSVCWEVIGDFGQRAKPLPAQGSAAGRLRPPQRKVDRDSTTLS